MPHPSPTRRPHRHAAGRRTRRVGLARLWPSSRLRRRWQRAYSRTSVFSKAFIGTAVVLALALATNWVYQVISKPTELFFPVSDALYKTPSETWRQYGPIFREYATTVISSDLLAALAQVESSGNPVVRTYWRWSWTTRPFEVYRPASSAVGMYQITDGTFAEAKRYCIRNHTVTEDGPWNSWQSCWFNSLYTRVLPGDAVELTSAYLDRSVASILDRHGMTGIALRQRQKLAAVIHLCGAMAGDEYAGRGFRLISGQRCGDHDVRVYLAHVNTMRRVFERLAGGQSDSLSPLRFPDTSPDQLAYQRSR